MESKKFQLVITMTGPLLGSQPGSDTPASQFMARKFLEKNPEKTLDVIADEAETAVEEVEKGTTVFHRFEDKPILYNYIVKGLIKNAGEVLNGEDGFKQLRSKLDDVLFVSPRRLTIVTDKPITFYERPLRVLTMKGPRVCLARSEMVEEGATITCELELLKTVKIDITEKFLRTMLDYASKAGLGQFRNSGHWGQFDYELTAI